MLPLDRRHTERNAQFAERIHLQRHFHQNAVSRNGSADLLPRVVRKHAPCVLQEARIRSRHRKNLVPLAQRHVAFAHNRIHGKRHCEVEHQRGFEHLGNHSPVYVELQRIISAKHGGKTHIPAHDVGLQGREVIRHIVVQRKYAVPRPEAHFGGQFVGIDACLRVGDIGGAPDSEYGAIGYDGEYEIMNNKKHR